MKLQDFLSYPMTSINLFSLAILLHFTTKIQAQPDLLNVMQNGNVGIGTTAPLYPLDIFATQGVIRMVSTTHASGSVIELKNLAGSPGFFGAINFNNAASTFPGQIGYTGTNAMTFRTNGSERLRIIANGNVGIGTITPGAKLHVANQIRVGEDLSFPTVYGELKHDGGSNGFIINANANGTWADMYLQTDGTTRMFIESAGNVGIGTTNLPTGYRLSVNGKIICEELKVQLMANWPDYVFDEDYKIPSLDNLEKEIKRIGHLPGMPSASEVQNSGIEVGEMQRLLLEKIEELTLYVIDLKKENSMMENEIAYIKSKIK